VCSDATMSTCPGKQRNGQAKVATLVDTKCLQTMGIWFHINQPLDMWSCYVGKQCHGEVRCCPNLPNTSVFASIRTTDARALGHVPEE
jgi:hypothetical protein